MMMSEKDLAESGSGVILMHYPGIRLEVLRKSTKNPNQDSGRRDRESNPGLPE
jgi:hypothetical protein